MAESFPSYLMHDLTGFLILFTFVFMMISLLERIHTLVNLFLLKRKEERRLRQGFIRTEDFYRYSTEEFVIWCEDFLRRMGYTNLQKKEINTVEGTAALLCADAEGRDTFVLCKRCMINGTWSLTGRTALDELIGAMASEKVKKGILLTDGIIEDNISEYGKNVLSVELKILDGRELTRIANSKAYLNGK